jgi:hypothetical protein
VVLSALVVLMPAPPIPVVESATPVVLSAAPEVVPAPPLPVVAPVVLPVVLPVTVAVAPLVTGPPVVVPPLVVGVPTPLAPIVPPPVRSVAAPPSVFSPVTSLDPEQAAMQSAPLTSVKGAARNQCLKCVM